MTPAASLPMPAIERDTLATFKTPGRRYWLALLTAAGITALGTWTFAILMKRGLGITGLDEPVMWGGLIASFVAFIGISHSGTLVSAILYFTRSPLRSSVGRSAEAMTVIAIMTAGLYPLMHMGRTWFAFWLLPYWNQRQLWPNFHSPLIWDIFAVCCYMTISILFLYMGMLPDLALLAKRVKGWRRTLYRVMSLGFSNTDAEWNLFERAYPIFAAVAIPLAVSVHSVVSWDFAMTLVPGWHSTIFAPYFVAGAIFSGLAMAIILLAFLRKGYNLHAYLREAHFEILAKLLLAMSFVMTSVYLTELFMAHYRGSPTEVSIFTFRMFGHYALVYWVIILCNCVIPLLVLFRRFRRSIGWMVFVSVAVIIGMWFERFMFVVTSLSHNYEPYGWRFYMLSAKELTLCLAGFGFFALLFMVFAKLLPSISVSETMQAQHAAAHAGDEGAHG